MTSLRRAIAPLVLVPLALAAAGAVEEAAESLPAPAVVPAPAALPAPAVLDAPIVVDAPVVVDAATVTPVPAADANGDLPDFIDPLASDLRVGYGVQLGRSQRSRDSASTASEHDLGTLVEQGLAVLYVRDLSDAQRALAGGFTWRCAAGLAASRAALSNPHGSGTVTTVLVELGAGPAWATMADPDSQFEWELMPFIGIGRSAYDDEYRSLNGSLYGPTAISAAGVSGEFGLLVNAVWYGSSGWGVAAQAGVVQRLSRLHGDSTTKWSDGTVANEDFTSRDTLTGARFGLSVSKRF